MRILVVEDEPELNALLVRWFAERGNEAFGLTGGADLIAWVTRRRFDLVILDLILPGTNGLSLIRRVRETSPQTRVIVMSGVDDPPAALKAIQEGASHYLSKPLDFDELQRAMEKKNW
jgi:two-component system phosphate regulon response regulator OmpR